MEASERTFLLETSSSNYRQDSLVSGLCLTFAIICIVDVFGVFPIISLPKAIIDCGYVGFLMVIAVCFVQIYTAILLGRCWLLAEDIEPNIQIKNRYPYSALAEFTYGKSFSKLVTILVDLTIFGGGIPNIIVASQNLQFLGLKFTSDSFNMSFCYWIIIMGIIMCPFLWLGSPKDMKLLCTASSFIVILVSVLLFGCILFDEETSEIDISASKNNSLTLWQNVLSAYSMLVFQFDVHPTILNIQVDMMDKSKIDLAIISGFAVSLTVFAVITVTAVVRYGSNFTPNLLEMLPNATTTYLAMFLVALQLSLSSAIGNTALYQHMEDIMGISRDFNRKRCIIRSILVFLGILAAESVPRFDIVMSLIGGALTGPLVFIFPPLLYIKMLKLKRIHDDILQLECFRNIVYHTSGPSGSTTKYSESSLYIELNDDSDSSYLARHQNDALNWKPIFEICFCYLIIFLGAVAGIITTYWNIHSTVQYVTFSPPCIFSVYNATVF